MDKIQAKILSHNLNGMPIFLARLTQRGAKIRNMDDLMQLYNSVIDKTPSEKLMKLPHTTLRRMCYITVAVVGLSTKAVSQLRTHARRLTFLSTSTQYSSFADRPDNFVEPEFIDNYIYMSLIQAYNDAEMHYQKLLRNGCDKDTASYVLPQGLRKALIISGNLDDWEYVMRTRLCNRNTKEVQYIMELILAEIIGKIGPEYTVNMFPSCVYDKCKECKFSCGHKYHFSCDCQDGTFEV